jgi:Carboxypeptidase regulatory-like domain
MKRNGLCLFLFLVSAMGAGGQTGRGGIDGFVMRDIVAVLPGAIIGIDSLTKGFHRETATNTGGYYLVDDLEPGGYSVRAEVKGYGCIIYPHVVVFAGQRARQDFHFARAKRVPGNCEPVARKDQ